MFLGANTMFLSKLRQTYYCLIAVPHQFFQSRQRVLTLIGPNDRAFRLLGMLCEFLIRVFARMLNLLLAMGFPEYYLPLFFVKKLTFPNFELICDPFSLKIAS